MNPKTAASSRPQARPQDGTAGRSTVDPRVRERWIAARRAEGRRRLKILVAIGLVVLVGVAVWVVAASPLLDVNRVVVKGAVRSTAGQVRAAADVHAGDAMVWLDTDAIADRVAALPWVRRVHVAREWPGTVTIRLTERTAVAWVAGSSGPVLVDRTGRVLERVAEAPGDVPQLVDVEHVPPVGVQITPRTGADVAGRLVGVARSGTHTITLTPNGVNLGLVSGLEIRLGEPHAVMMKVRAALAVLGALGGDAVSYIDVTVPTNPVAGPPS